MSRSTLWRKRENLKAVRKEIIDRNQYLRKILHGNNHDVSQAEEINTSNFTSNSIPNGEINIDMNSEMEHCRDDIYENECIRLDASIGSNLENSEDQDVFSEREPQPKEFAAALIIMKNRHRLSNSSINHLCELWKYSNLKYVPKNYKRIINLLMDENSEAPPGNLVYICYVCKTSSTISSNCISSKCSEHKKYTKRPFEFLSLAILPQLRNILARETKLNSIHQSGRASQSDNTIADICDGDVYKRIIQVEKEPFLSLIMNIDGVEISKSSSSSLWITTYAINEIYRKERFKIKNIIVGGILTAPSKPSSDIIRIFMRPSVDELILLEKGVLLEFHSNGESVMKTVKIFLIAGCCDKPAQSLVQGISEPIGAYGCGRCEIEGITVSVEKNSKKKIRVFPLPPKNDPQPRLRSNEVYDELINEIVNLRVMDHFQKRKRFKGQINICILRELTYFDVGRSFLSDSLHNIYRGVMSRLLHLWFEKKYRYQSWSIASKIENVDHMLMSIHYPSTSIRIPRSIIKFHKFKANELRAVCLFGFIAFCRALPPKYAQHFLLLVIAIHIAESRCIDRELISNVRITLNKFLRLFPILYSVRHNTQSVHSLEHIVDSITDFGSLGNYSTFNFESVLGSITSCVHSTRRFGQEIQNNLNLLRSATIEIDKPTYHSRLKQFVEVVGMSKRSTLFQSLQPTQDISFRGRESSATEIMQIRINLGIADIVSYRSCYASNVRFSKMVIGDERQSNDSCIMFNFAGELKIGFISGIFQVRNNFALLQIQPVAITDKLHLKLSNIKLICPNVFHGDIQSSHGLIYVKPIDILEKLIFVYEKQLKSYVFCRIPNLLESS